MNNRLRLFGCYLFLLATLAACGGGSSDGGPSAAPPANTNNNSGGSGSAPPPNNSGSAPPPTTTSGLRIAYVAGNLGISAYSVNSDDGKLSEVAGSPFAPATPFVPETRPTWVKVDPSNRFVYSTDGRGVHAYDIDHATGALSEIAGSPFGTGGLGVILIHPTGQFVYAVDRGGGGVWAYRVAPTGALVQVAGAPFSVGSIPTDIAIDPSGKYAYVPDCLNSLVHAFQIDLATGALTSPTDAFAETHPCGVAVDPSGKFAFAASSGGPRDGDQAGVWSFSIEPATGVLTQIGFVAAGLSPNRVAVHSSGQFAYAINFTSSDVSAFRIDAGGTLTSIGAAVPTGEQPGSITLDPSGRFAYVTSDRGTISGYRIDANTGALTEIEGSPLATRNLPASMTITGVL